EPLAERRALQLYLFRKLLAVVEIAGIYSRAKRQEVECRSVIIGAIILLVSRISEDISEPNIVGYIDVRLVDDEQQLAPLKGIAVHRGVLGIARELLVGQLLQLIGRRGRTGCAEQSLQRCDHGGTVDEGQAAVRPIFMGVLIVDDGQVLDSLGRLEQYAQPRAIIMGVVHVQPVDDVGDHPILPATLISDTDRSTLSII